MIVWSNRALEDLRILVEWIEDPHDHEGGTEGDNPLWNVKTCELSTYSQCSQFVQPTDER